MGKENTFEKIDFDQVNDMCMGIESKKREDITDLGKKLNEGKIDDYTFQSEYDRIVADADFEIKVLQTRKEINDYIEEGFAKARKELGLPPEK